MKLNIVLVILSLVAGLIISEYLIKTLKLSPQLISLNIDNVKSGYKSSSNPILGYELKENYHDDNPNLHFGNFPKTNSHGQRDIERIYSKPQNSKRILLLGDSVAGHGIFSLHDTISRQLEQLLSERSKVEVLNFGVGGYQTLAEIELLKVKGLRYSPDLVILVFESNDFLPANNDISRYDPQINPIFHWLIKKSALFRFISLKFNLFHLKFHLDPKFREKHHRSFLNNSVDIGIKKLKNLSMQHNFDVFVIIWPRFTKIKKYFNKIDDFYPNKKYLNILMNIEEICKKYSIDSYRLVPFFIKDYNQRFNNNKKARVSLLSPNDLYTIGDTGHPNIEGSGVAAKSIQDILNQRHFLK